MNGFNHWLYAGFKYDCGVCLVFRFKSVEARQKWLDAHPNAVKFSADTAIMHRARKLKWNRDTAPHNIALTTKPKGKQ